MRALREVDGPMSVAARVDALPAPTAAAAPGVGDVHGGTTALGIEDGRSVAEAPATALAEPRANLACVVAPSCGPGKGDAEEPQRAREKLPPVDATVAPAADESSARGLAPSSSIPEGAEAGAADALGYSVRREALHPARPGPKKSGYTGVPRGPERAERGRSTPSHPSRAPAKERRESRAQPRHDGSVARASFPLLLAVPQAAEALHTTEEALRARLRRAQAVDARGHVTAPLGPGIVGLKVGTNTWRVRFDDVK